SVYLSYISVSELFSLYVFFFSCYGDHRDLHSFPTRRSSDLGDFRGQGRLVHAGAEGRVSGVLSTGERRRAFQRALGRGAAAGGSDRKSTRLNSSHVEISYAVFCLKKKKKNNKVKL